MIFFVIKNKKGFDNMKEKIGAIKLELDKDLETIKTTQDIVDIKAKYIGKNGCITELTKNMKDLSPEERKEAGMLSNEIKNYATSKILGKEEEINNAILNEKLSKEAIDITLPGTEIVN